MDVEQNMGTADRIIRPTLAAGIIALVAAKVIKGSTAKILLGFSAIFLVTSSIGWCPAYAAVGFDTMPDEEELPGKQDPVGPTL